MPVNKQVTLTGGGFQDAEGNPLNAGYVIIRLNSDAMVTGADVIVTAGQTIKITLDSSGNVSGSPLVWTTDFMTSSVGKAYYIVSAYTSKGQRVWGPWQEVIPSGSNTTYDIKQWLPTNADNP